jgi:glycosyltransferase involved in cell wall biosynthesis
MICTHISTSYISFIPLHMHIVLTSPCGFIYRVIPLICARFPNVHFIIGGDGPKKLLLEEMRERHQLHERVELLGAVPNGKVRDVSRTYIIYIDGFVYIYVCVIYIVVVSSCNCVEWHINCSGSIYIYIYSSKSLANNKKCFYSAYL